MVQTDATYVTSNTRRGWRDDRLENILPDVKLQYLPIPCLKRLPSVVHANPPPPPHIMPPEMASPPPTVIYAIYVVSSVLARKTPPPRLSPGLKRQYTQNRFWVSGYIYESAVVVLTGLVCSSVLC